MDSRRSPAVGLVAILLAAIAALLVVLGAASAIALVQVDDSGLWDDAGPAVALAASVFGLMGMALRLVAQVADDERTEEQLDRSGAAMAAAEDLRQLTTELSSGYLRKDDVDVEAARAETRDLLGRLGPDEAAAERLRAAFDEFREAVGASGGDLP
ncbi:hypothetical protein [Modestobacter lapidis]|nr:hypothetical protein [Modestobacter lapidis]